MFYIKCEGISKAQFNELQEICTTRLFCHSCSLNSDKTFNYDFSLQRLSKEVKDKRLECGIKMENISMRKEDHSTMSSRCELKKNCNLVLDSVAEEMLKSCALNVPGKLPIYSTGNGNCLFNSISIALA